MDSKLRRLIDAKFAGNRGRGTSARGIRYYDVARQLGIYPSRLCEYVNGRRAIPWWDLMAMRTPRMRS
jgi:hypothetical protein